MRITNGRTSCSAFKLYQVFQGSADRTNSFIINNSTILVFLSVQTWLGAFPITPSTNTSIAITWYRRPGFVHFSVVQTRTFIWIDTIITFKNKSRRTFTTGPTWTGTDVVHGTVVSQKMKTGTSRFARCHVFWMNLVWRTNKIISASRITTTPASRYTFTENNALRSNDMYDHIKMNDVWERPVSPGRHGLHVNEMKWRVYWVVMPNLINETLIFQPNIPKKKTEITNSITRNVMVFLIFSVQMSRWTSHYGIIDWPILATSVQNRSSLFHIGLLMKWFSRDLWFLMNVMNHNLWWNLFMKW